MSCLVRLPAELLIVVFENCENFEELINLVETCKYVHGVWEKNQVSIISRFGKKHILAFNDALMAVSSLFLPGYFHCRYNF